MAARRLGAVPTRPSCAWASPRVHVHLHAGVTDPVTTRDAEHESVSRTGTAGHGHRHVAGRRADRPDTSYSVTVNSFLAAGGDNFRELANGTTSRHRQDRPRSDGRLHGTFAATPACGRLPQRAVGVAFPAARRPTYEPGRRWRSASGPGRCRTPTTSRTPRSWSRWAARSGPSRRQHDRDRPVRPVRHRVGVGAAAGERLQSVPTELVLTGAVDRHLGHRSDRRVREGDSRPRSASRAS